MSAPAETFTAAEFLIQAAQRLADEIGEQVERDRRSYAAGYRDGAALARAMFDHGVDVGRAQARHQRAEREGQICRELADTASQLHRARQYRDQPGPLYRAELARRAARGLGEYTGGPVEWEGTT